MCFLSLPSPAQVAALLQDRLPLLIILLLLRRGTSSSLSGVTLTTPELRHH